MKLLSILLFIGSFFYAGATHRDNFDLAVVTVLHDTLNQKKDTVNWIDDFKLFRAAINQNDKAVVKQYFKFPVYNEANEIWILVLPESGYSKVAGKKKLAFLEKDLDKYYAKLFPASFKKSILKVKTDVLFRLGSVETPEIKEGTTTYKMYVAYDKKLHTLSLNLSYNTVLKDENGEIQDGGESNVIYNFIIDNTGHIYFKEVRLAG